MNENWKPVANDLVKLVWHNALEDHFQFESVIWIFFFWSGQNAEKREEV